MDINARIRYWDNLVVAAEAFNASNNDDRLGTSEIELRFSTLDLPGLVSYLKTKDEASARSVFAIWSALSVKVEAVKQAQIAKSGFHPTQTSPGRISGVDASIAFGQSMAVYSRTSELIAELKTQRKAFDQIVFALL